jgi:hypothetical protein
VLIRQSAPVIGATSSPYQTRGTWRLSASFRGLTSDKHYAGTVRQIHRDQLGTYVINKQRMLDLGFTYGVTDNLELTLGIPFVSASWSLPTPMSPVPGPRAEQNASGLGDISLTGRYWLLDTEQSRQNFSIGVGLKVPSGRTDVVDTYPNITGGNSSLKAVDQSIQPGDGGFGLMLEGVGFRVVGPVALFGSLNYLINPRNTNDTPSIIVGLVGNNPAFGDRLFNSVPDQYVARFGGSVATPLSGLTASLSGRLEGVPRYDLIGRSDGFRRPGKAGFIEPGLAFSKGGSTFTFNIPVAVYRNRPPNPYTDQEGDATFPNHIFLVGYSYQLN